MSVTSASTRTRSTRAPRARERSREATRERLVQSGTELFAARGLHKVTSHDIARGAGVAAGTFYLHFSDKEGLFREIAFEAAARLRERLDRAAFETSGVEQGVRARTVELLAFAEENRDLVRILFGRDGESAGVGSDVLDYLARDVASGVKQRRAEGTAPPDLDPEVASQALVGMCARVVSWWAEEPGPVPRESVIDTLTRVQLSGVHTRAERP